MTAKEEGKTVNGLPDAESESSLRQGLQTNDSQNLSGFCDAGKRFYRCVLREFSLLSLKISHFLEVIGEGWIAWFVQRP